MPKMEIIIWRHGKAESSSPTGRDSDRDLTSEGRDSIIRIAEQLKKNGIAIQKIFTSPYKRTLESSRLIQETLQCKQGIEVLEPLTSGTSTEKLVSALKKLHPEFESVILVGHMPDLGWLLEQLTGNQDGNAPLKAGALVKISLENFTEPLNGKITLSLSPE